MKNDAERGWMLENIVYMALRRKGGRVSHVVNRDGTEVDFHVHDAVSHSERLVQVSYAMSDEKTFAREMNALKLAREDGGVQGLRHTAITGKSKGQVLCRLRGLICFGRCGDLILRISETRC